VTRRVAIGLAIGFAASAISSFALATDVRGTLALRGDLPAAPEERGRYYWQAENGVLPTRKPRVQMDRDVAVVLHGAAPGGAPAIVTVRMIDGGLKPAAVVVRPGTLVRFENDDPMAHELYVPNPADAAGQPWFKAEATGRASTRDVRFQNEGIFEIRCKRAPHLRGWVAVENITAMATPSTDGRFTFPDAAPGNYKIKVFHAGRWIHEAALEIEDDRSQDVEVSATLPAAPASAAPGASAAPASAAPGASASAAPGAR
jgi:plastocyanin